jgi:hypothetical protein
MRQVPGSNLELDSPPAFARSFIVKGRGAFCTFLSIPDGGVGGQASFLGPYSKKRYKISSLMVMSLPSSMYALNLVLTNE